jgi:short-subunit dehydrogenase
MKTIMKPKLSDQVVVITGASSGIGKETALQFGAAGAAVVLAARSAGALEYVADSIRAGGGRAHVVLTDVSKLEDIERLRDEALNAFGRIDTWVNNASIEEWATVDDHTPEEIEQIVRTNLLGTIFGTKAALAHMRTRGSGTIINVGSVESKRSLPLQSIYAATKHGVKGFTQSLRMELMRDRQNIHAVLILPASIDTPIFEHGRTKLGGRHARPIPVTYAPAAVAEAIVYASRHPRSEIVIGGAGKMFTLMERLMPNAADRVMTAGGAFFKAQTSRRRARGDDNLFEPSKTHSISGGWRAKRRSTYTRMFGQHPAAARLMLAGLAVGVGAYLARRKRLD